MDNLLNIGCLYLYEIPIGINLSGNNNLSESRTGFSDTWTDISVNP
jgi:hypothetical protein